CPSVPELIMSTLCSTFHEQVPEIPLMSAAVDLADLVVFTCAVGLLVLAADSACTGCDHVITPTAARPRINPSFIVTIIRCASWNVPSTFTFFCSNLSYCRKLWSRPSITAKQVK